MNRARADLEPFLATEMLNDINRNNYLHSVHHAGCISRQIVPFRYISWIS